MQISNVVSAKPAAKSSASYEVLNERALAKRVGRCAGEVLGQNSANGCFFEGLDCPSDTPSCGSFDSD